jgi:hypothetical protein
MAMAYGFGFPHSIELSVERDGREVLHEQRSLTYSDQYANGPECGVACRSASVGVTVPVGEE